MDKQEARKHFRAQEVIAILIMTVVMLGVYSFLRSDFVQDAWRGWWYEEPAAVAALRDDLELTSQGERIFLATHPAIEAEESFNEHCGEHEDEVSLLGCYNAGKIYVYDVKLDDLKDSNKVTAAHELLHAVWARMPEKERMELKMQLEQIRQEKPEWVQEEINFYKESEQTEELYARVGTKLKDIPEDLEKHYGKYFQNRSKIVEYYENYQAPFRELKEKNEDLRRQILQIGPEIDADREIYDRRFAELTSKVEQFNLCAEAPGCFATQQAFQYERAKLEQEREELDKIREELNQKIERNNDLLREYEANRRDLGELNAALNSNVKDKLN